MNRKQRELKRKKAQHHTKTEGKNFVKLMNVRSDIQWAHPDFEYGESNKDFWLIRLFVWVMNFFKTPGKGI